MQRKEERCDLLFVKSLTDIASRHSISINSQYLSKIGVAFSSGSQRATRGTHRRNGLNYCHLTQKIVLIVAPGLYILLNLVSILKLGSQCPRKYIFCHVVVGTARLWANPVKYFMLPRGVGCLRPRNML